MIIIACFPNEGWWGPPCDIFDCQQCCTSLWYIYFESVDLNEDYMLITSTLIKIIFDALISVVNIIRVYEFEIVAFTLERQYLTFGYLFEYPSAYKIFEMLWYTYLYRDVLGFS